MGHCGCCGGESGMSCASVALCNLSSCRQSCLLCSTHRLVSVVVRYWSGSSMSSTMSSSNVQWTWAAQFLKVDTPTKQWQCVCDTPTVVAASLATFVLTIVGWWLSPWQILIAGRRRVWGVNSHLSGFGLWEVGYGRGGCFGGSNWAVHVEFLVLCTSSCYYK